jgi:hypothetical protein
MNGVGAPLAPEWLPPAMAAGAKRYVDGYEHLVNVRLQLRPSKPGHVHVMFTPILRRIHPMARRWTWASRWTLRRPGLVLKRRDRKEVVQNACTLVG